MGSPTVYSITLDLLAYFCTATASLRSSLRADPFCGIQDYGINKGKTFRQLFIRELFIYNVFIIIELIYCAILCAVCYGSSLAFLAQDSCSSECSFSASACTGRKNKCYNMFIIIELRCCAILCAVCYGSSLAFLAEDSCSSVCSVSEHCTGRKNKCCSKLRRRCSTRHLLSRFVLEPYLAMG
jgi:hypothetical protein